MLWGNIFFSLPRDRLTKDDVYIFPNPLIFSFIICQSPGPFHSLGVFAHIQRSLLPNTPPGLHGRFARAARLLISSINVTLSHRRGVSGGLLSPKLHRSWLVCVPRASLRRGSHGGRPQPRVSKRTSQADLRPLVGLQGFKSEVRVSRTPPTLKSRGLTQAGLCWWGL